jgi:hypothetical protein
VVSSNREQAGETGLGFAIRIDLLKSMMPPELARP